MTRPCSTLVAADVVAGSKTDAWSAERVALLQLHYLQGLSAAESARLICGVSRNAVISKRYRMGLFGRLETRPRLKRVEPREAGGRVRYRCLAPREDMMAVTPLPRMDLAPPPDARPAKLVDRAAKSCAWPLGPAEEPGDAATLFCGAPAPGPSPYCDVHAARARRPPAD